MKIDSLKLKRIPSKRPHWTMSEIFTEGIFKVFVYVFLEA